MSARRPRRRHHRAARPLLLVLAGLLAVGGWPGPAAAGPASSPVVDAAPSRTPSPEPRPSGRADRTAEDAPTDDEPAPPVEVLVTEVTPRVVSPTDDLVVRVTVRNTGEDALAAPRAVLRVNRVLQSTRSSLDQWVEEELTGTAGTPITSVDLPGALAPGQSADVELRVPAGELPLSTSDAAWGPRGVSVEVTDAGRRQGIQRTFALWLPTDVPITPTRVSVLVPVTGGPVDPTATAPADPTEGTPTGTEDGTEAAASADGGTDEGTEEPNPSPPTDAAPTDPSPTDAAPAPEAPLPAGVPPDDVVDRLDAVLDATEDLPTVTWAVDPALLAAARGAPAGTPAQRWVDELTAAATGHDVLTLPAHDPDLAALAHGAGDDLAQEAVRAAAAATDPVLGPAPRGDVAWPAQGQPDLATVSLAARTGASAVVLGGGALATDELTYTPTGRATVDTAAGPVAALVGDDVLTAQLSAPSDPTPATAAQRVLAETAVIARERPSELRHVLAALDRGWRPDVAVAGAQLAALAAAPWVDLAPLSTLIGAADRGLDRVPLPDREVGDDEIRPGELADLRRARAGLASFATIVPDPPALLAGVDDAVLAPTSVAWRRDPVQRSAVVDAVVDDLTARRAGVSVVPGSGLLLISESGLFSLGLRNDLPQEATVQVAVEPAGSLLVIDEAQTVSIPSASETQVRIPFHAVGSGDVAVDVLLRAPDGTALGPSQRFTVRVRADWENVGTAIVAGLVAVAFVVGIVRTIRRGQTAKRGAGGTPVTEIARLPEDPA